MQKVYGTLSEAIFNDGLYGNECDGGEMCSPPSHSFPLCYRQFQWHLMDTNAIEFN